MAISPTSDLILDVARAADPAQAQASTRALAAASSGVDQGAAFAATLDRAAPQRLAIPPEIAYHNPSASIRSPLETPEHKAAVGLESVLLKSFVDQMMPKDAVNVFGSGTAGDVWKSMLSEKIANEVAKSGSLNLAKRLFAGHPDLLKSHRHNLAQVAPTAIPPTRI